MGTPDIAKRVLEQLCLYEEVVGVFTQPDSIAKRGKKLVPSPVKEKALELDIPVFCPEKIKEEQSTKQLRALKPDVVIVVAYGQILNREVLDIPRMGCLNIHVSLLPKWRGAAPIERAILAGDKQIGLCLMKMDEGLDTGPYCYSKASLSDNKSYDDIVDAMVDNIGEQLHTVLDNLDYSPDSVEWVEQDESLATYAEKIGKHELYISLTDDSETVLRKVLASSASRAAKIEICGRTCALKRTQVSKDISITGEVGDVIYQNKKLYLIASDRRTIEVLNLKPDGKNEMNAKSFCAGLPNLRNNAKGTWNSVI